MVGVRRRRRRKRRRKERKIERKKEKKTDFHEVLHCKENKDIVIFIYIIVMLFLQHWIKYIGSCCKILKYLKISLK